MILSRVITYLRITFDAEGMEVRLSDHKLGGRKRLREGGREGGRDADRKGWIGTEGGKESGREEE